MAHARPPHLYCSAKGVHWPGDPSGLVTMARMYRKERQERKNAVSGWLMRSHLPPLHLRFPISSSSVPFRPLLTIFIWAILVSAGRSAPLFFSPESRGSLPSSPCPSLARASFLAELHLRLLPRLRPPLESRPLDSCPSARSRRHGCRRRSLLAQPHLPRGRGRSPRGLQATGSAQVGPRHGLPRMSAGPDHGRRHFSSRL